MPAFAEFCETHAAAIAAIIEARVVSTNEVRRCALLLPAFARAAARLGEPLHLVEVGTSAGLKLLWDHYAYDGRHGAGKHRQGKELAFLFAAANRFANRVKRPVRQSLRGGATSWVAPPNFMEFAGVDLSTETTHGRRAGRPPNTPIHLGSPASRLSSGLHRPLRQMAS